MYCPRTVQLASQLNTTSSMGSCWTDLKWWLSSKDLYHRSAFQVKVRYGRTVSSLTHVSPNVFLLIDWSNLSTTPLFICLFSFILWSAHVAIWSMLTEGTECTHQPWHQSSFHLEICRHWSIAYIHSQYPSFRIIARGGSIWDRLNKKLTLLRYNVHRRPIWGAETPHILSRRERLHNPTATPD